MAGRPKKYSDVEVIEIAMNEFWKNGYEACSTDNLCNKMSLGKGSFYNSFKSKEALYIKTLKFYHEQWIIEQISILSQPLGIVQRLENLLNWAIEKDFEDGSKGCYLINAAMERGKNDKNVVFWTKKHAVLLGAKIETEIQLSIDNQELDALKDSEMLATMFLTGYYGLRTLNATLQNKDMAKNIAANIMEPFKI